MSKHFDLIIVGAGPAGCSAAFTTAKEGISVLLLEEHPQIGVPLACAEGLSRSTIKGYLEIKPEWIAGELSGSIVRGPNNDEFKIEYPKVGWVLNRKVFDLALAKLAESCGAVVKTSARALGVDGDEIIVKESGSTQRYKFEFLIGADGITSHVGRWMGIDTRLNLDEIVICAEYLIEDISIDSNYTYLIFGEQYAPGGYAWIFPKGRNAANIGVGISPVCTKKPAKYFLDQWVAQEFKQGCIKECIYGGVPAKVLKKFSGQKFFLVGDAARLTDPLSGAGIANGIKSGVIAGRNVLRRLKGKKDYFEAEIKKEILNEIKFHRRVRKIYLRLTNKEYNEIFEIGRRIFKDKKIADINTHHLIKDILWASPQLFRLGFNLLF